MSEDGRRVLKAGDWGESNSRSELTQDCLRCGNTRWERLPEPKRLSVPTADGKTRVVNKNGNS